MRENEEKSLTYNGAEITETNSVKKLFKRLGRKLTYWYVHPFGEKQNSFNKDILNSVEELKQKAMLTDVFKKDLSDVQIACKTIINELNAVKLRSTLNSNTIQKMQEDEKEEKSLLDEYLLEINPEIRKGVGGENTKILTSYGYSGLGEKISSLRRADNETVSENLLKEIEKCYLKGAKNELELLKIRESRNTVLILCAGFFAYHGIEAVRNEAYDLYSMLKCKSIYNAKLVSLEPDFTDVQVKDDVIYLPMKDTETVKNEINNINPHLIVFCESTANILFVNNANFILNKSIAKLSCQNPLQGLPKEAVEELCHLNDYGVHKYCVQSKNAYDIMVKNGFKEPVVAYPIVDNSKNLFSIQRKAFDKNNVVAGFASSPMTEEQMEYRGMSVLADMVKLLPDVTFKILWRNTSLPVPEAIKNAPNCIVEYGRYDMQKFYSEIDLLVIPYYSIDFNHACSMSAVEAMLNGIPVAATRISGVSELVDYCGLGETAEHTGEAMADAVKSIISSCEIYQSADASDKIQKLKAYMSNVNTLKLIEQEMKKDLPKGVITLHQWDTQLKYGNKHLVKGPEKMKEYYMQQEIAGNYNAERFLSYPENCFDLLERKSLNIIIEDYFSKKPLKIMDIACGDGRILSEDIKYGSCTAVDSSFAMLEIVKKRFAENADMLYTINDDFFTSNINDDFHLITTFRYIRHFEYAMRKKLYRKIQDALKPDGLLVFDVPNIKFEMMQKTKHGWDKYNIYDVFWDKDDFIDEMKTNGFKVEYLIPVGQGLVDTLSDYRLEPMTWTAAVSKA